eukprot:6160602-Amphidinium_carterae.1
MEEERAEPSDSELAKCLRRVHRIHAHSPQCAERPPSPRARKPFMGKGKAFYGPGWWYWMCKGLACNFTQSSLPNTMKVRPRVPVRSNSTVQGQSLGSSFKVLSVTDKVTSQKLRQVSSKLLLVGCPARCPEVCGQRMRGNFSMSQYIERYQCRTEVLIDAFGELYTILLKYLQCQTTLKFRTLYSKHIKQNGVR